MGNPSNCCRIQGGLAGLPRPEQEARPVLQDASHLQVAGNDEVSTSVTFGRIAVECHDNRRLRRQWSPLHDVHCRAARLGRPTPGGTISFENVLTRSGVMRAAVRAECRIASRTNPGAEGEAPSTQATRDKPLAFGGIPSVGGFEGAIRGKRRAQDLPQPGRSSGSAFGRYALRSANLLRGNPERSEGGDPSRLRQRKIRTRLSEVCFGGGAKGGSTKHDTSTARPERTRDTCFKRLSILGIRRIDSSRRTRRCSVSALSGRMPPA